MPSHPASVPEIGFVRTRRAPPGWQLDGTIPAAWHLLVTVLGGEARYRIDGRDQRMVRGDLFCLRPGMQRTADTDPRNPIEFILCGFRTNEPLPLRRSCGNRSPVFRLAGEMLAGWQGAAPGGQHLAYARLHELLSILMEGDSPSGDPRIAELVTRLGLVPPARLPSAEVAARSCSLSVSRFRGLFRAEMGLPYQQWLIRCRLDAARRQLLNGDAGIQEAAARAGFGDPHYFSRMFRRHLGITPSSCLPAGGVEG